eukprot:885149-Prorocentrum_minimum.AAC.1
MVATKAPPESGAVCTRCKCEVAVVRCKTRTLVENTKTGRASPSPADNAKRPLLQLSWRLNKVLSHKESWSSSRSVLSAGDSEAHPTSTDVSINGSDVATPKSNGHLNETAFNNEYTESKRAIEACVS